MELVFSNSPLPTFHRYQTTDLTAEEFFAKGNLSIEDCDFSHSPDQWDEELLKAILATPRHASGKIDWASIPVGDSVFVRIKKAGHPMEGRVILLTKRPDKQFAVAGGWGSTKVANQSLAMRHLAFNTREPAGQRTDRKSVV